LRELHPGKKAGIKAFGFKPVTMSGFDMPAGRRLTARDPEQIEITADYKEMILSF